MFYPYSYQYTTPLLNSWQQFSLPKYATTHATADQDAAHELRPRLFPTFVVKPLPLWSNFALVYSASALHISDTGQNIMPMSLVTTVNMLAIFRRSIRPRNEIFRIEENLEIILTITTTLMCHKLHLAISPSILHQFSRSQWLRKALEKTFRSVPVTSRGDQ